ncbi:MAG: prolipoprotein diacylglyceryl transferase family protein [Bacteroidota bacterium]
MNLPFEPKVFGYAINIHLVMEYLAFFVAYQYYRYLRKHSKDQISSENRLSIILGAALGAYLGSRFVGVLENPLVFNGEVDWYQLTQAKTIMGGLFGGLLGVEIAKKIIGEDKRSGDLFTLPIVVGIFVGRIGCFLSGIKDFTYGVPTEFFLGMDLGDGIIRHSLALYELLFLLGLFVLLRRVGELNKLADGELFQLFMVAYFGFRFFIEFLKPNTFLVLGLSTIQYLCLICFIYYHRFILKSLYAK